MTSLTTLRLSLRTRLDGLRMPDGDVDRAGHKQTVAAANFPVCDSLHAPAILEVVRPELLRNAAQGAV